MPTDLGTTQNRYSVGMSPSRFGANLPYAQSASGMATVVGRMLQYALSAVGVRYTWGGNDLSRGVDCSGLVAQAFYAAGYNLPRTAAMQQKAAVPVDGRNAQVGDLVFWAQTSSKDRVPGADHVGIYLGNGQVLEASSGQNRVVIRKLWGNYTFGRVIGAKDPTSGFRDVRMGRSGIDASQYVAGAPLGAATAGGSEAGGGGADPYAVAAAQVDVRIPRNATPEQILEFVTKHYGADIAAFAKIPELWDVVVQAGRDGATGDLIDARVKATNWWQSRTESMRQWDILDATDPKQAQVMAEQKMEALRPVWEQTGVDFDLQIFAKTAIRLGWDDNQVKQHVAQALQARSDREGLEQGTVPDVTADTLMARARNDYFVPIDRQLAEAWALDLFRGTKTEEQFLAYMGELAKGRFASLSDEVQGGLAPGQYMLPIKQLVAETLEVNPADVDLLDPMYSEILEYADPATGKIRPMTIAEAQTWARSQEAYKGTANANKTSGEFVEMLGQTFGAVA